MKKTVFLFVVVFCPLIANDLSPEDVQKIFTSVLELPMHLGKQFAVEDRIFEKTSSPGLKKIGIEGKEERKKILNICKTWEKASTDYDAARKLYQKDFFEIMQIKNKKEMNAIEPEFQNICKEFNGPAAEFFALVMKKKANDEELSRAEKQKLADYANLYDRTVNFLNTREEVDSSLEEAFMATKFVQQFKQHMKQKQREAAKKAIKEKEDDSEIIT